jgi:arylsulfatase A-like enzyme
MPTAPQANGAWQDVYPDCGYTPFRGTKGTDFEAGSRVPAIAWWPGTIEPGRRNSEIVGCLDFMATFASLAGVTLPAEDRGRPADDVRQLRPDRGPHRRRALGA